jgi:hypothetical protein
VAQPAEAAGRADQAVDLDAFGDQTLGEVRADEAGRAGDDGSHRG